MKKLLMLLLSLCLAAGLAACGAGTADQPADDGGDTAATGVTVRLGGLKGPTSMGMVKLLADNEDGTTANGYEFTMSGSADELTPKLL